MYNLERIEIWERPARINQPYRCETRAFYRVEQDSPFRDWDVMWMTEDEGEFCELGTRSCKS